MPAVAASPGRQRQELPLRPRKSTPAGKKWKIAGRSCFGLPCFGGSSRQVAVPVAERPAEGRPWLTCWPRPRTKTKTAPMPEAPPANVVTGDGAPSSRRSAAGGGGGAGEVVEEEPGKQEGPRPISGKGLRAAIAAAAIAMPLQSFSWRLWKGGKNATWSKLRRLWWSGGGGGGGGGEKVDVGASDPEPRHVQGRRCLPPPLLVDYHPRGVVDTPPPASSAVPFPAAEINPQSSQDYSSTAPRLGNAGTARQTPANKDRVVVVMSVMAVMLAMMALFGRVGAALLVCLWFYCLNSSPAGHDRWITQWFEKGAMQHDD